MVYEIEEIFRLEFLNFLFGKKLVSNLNNFIAEKKFFLKQMKIGFCQILLVILIRYGNITE